MAALALTAAAVGAPLAHADAPQPGLKAEYFDYTDLTGKVAERIDPAIDFDWDLAEPVPGVGQDFSARWTGIVTPEHSEAYTFITRADDGVRLWIGGELVVDDWHVHSAAERSGEIELEAGKAYDLELEYFDGLRHAAVKLMWRSASRQKEVVPTSALMTARPQDPAPIELPKDGGVPAVVVPAADGGSALPQVVPPSELPVGVEAPAALVSYGGPLAPPAPPVPGQTFNAAPEGGDVLIRRPADGQLIPLEQGASLPVGTHVDAREGAVDIQTAPAAGVAQPTQDAHFEGGMFRVDQGKRKGKVVNIDLLHGEFAEVCGPLSRRERRAIRRRGIVARAAANGRVLRRLWGKGKGRFRTRGRHAAATVRGTSWSIADRCDETSIRVHEGIVDVENLLTGAVVTLRAGERYAARP